LKIKLLNSLLIIDILTVLLILSILLIPSTPARIALGLPFLLFFPGYTLVMALFPVKKEGMDGIERIALSFGMSIAVTALIGLGLNYTPWGIRLEPVLYSITAFILIMSVIAIIRRNRIDEGFKTTTEVRITIPGWEGSAFNKTLTVILILAIVGSIGTLGYTIAKPKIGERFSEFYILGNNGKAENYPYNFVITQGKITKVSYDKGATLIDGNEGKVTVGIINQEQQETAYTVALQIDGMTTPISNNGASFNLLGPIKLQQGEKWEQEIGFAPQHIGDNQKAELFLYKDGAATAEETLHLWINVK
jgi:uncharacterized membrane protein